MTESTEDNGHEKYHHWGVATYVIASFILALLGKPAELAGFVVAGALGLVFLRLDEFKEFSGGGFSAKLRERLDEIQEELEPIKLKETEPDRSGEVTEETQRKIGLNPEEIRVLDAVSNSRYTWRTQRGVAKELKLDAEIIAGVISSLVDQSLVSKTVSGDRELYSATQTGHIVSMLAGEETGAV